jgi:pyruvate-ferredoxin/flavodoxin oxidoreductase
VSTRWTTVVEMQGEGCAAGAVAPDAERVLASMRSGAATVRATVARLGTAAKVGVLTVKPFRPFSVADFVAALPPTVRAIARLDRAKDPGAIGSVESSLVT